LQEPECSYRKSVQETDRDTGHRLVTDAAISVVAICFGGLIIHVLPRLLILIGVIPNTAVFPAERGISGASSQFSGIQLDQPHYYFLPWKIKDAILEMRTPPSFHQAWHMLT
jgi:hypothetical protein